MDISDAQAVLAAVKEKMQNAITFLENALATYRLGKANPAIFDSVMVNYYGSPTPLPQVAGISVPDAKTMFIQPWEKKMIAPIEKAIMAANLGFTPQNNGEVIRINVPPLTEERRRDLVKRAKTECENSKISMRNARREGVEQLKKMQKTGLSEDVSKDTEILIQKEIDTFSKKVDEIFAAKEKEIMTV